jgi:A/G-specific adenine glycosylase
LFAISDPIDTSKGKKLFTELAQDLIDKSQAGLFNQAIMDFGALQCTPASPDCWVCPLESSCMAYMQRKISEYPVKSLKPKIKTFYLYYFSILLNDYTYLNKREGQGIWRNLYEFPSVISETPLAFEDLIRHPDFLAIFPKNVLSCFRPVMKDRKHVLTHRILYADFYEVLLDKELPSLAGFKKISRSQIDDYPVHRLMQFYLEQSD